MSIPILLKRLSISIATLNAMLRTGKPVNDHSLSLELETVAIKLLNLTYDFQFSNSNLIKSNFNGVDGFDDGSRTLLQISSSCKLKKIENTIDKVLNSGIYEHYDRLVFFFSG